MQDEYDIAQGDPAREAAVLDQRETRAAPSGAADHRRAALDLVERAERAVVAALPRRVDERTLADSVGATLQHLRYAFRTTRGSSIYAALADLRLRHARDFLAGDPSLTPAAAANFCGFGHIGNFRRAFRQRFGHDPDHAAAPDSEPTA
ncbi:hypothetical protein CFHF_23655 [Caulobacter flavus]|uniref:HTH araC/xylS-type domain-containing protein n=1 Tax=Caulobacter flavus TaxID=1679497 RepID=A0A2N5CLX3_9CAUL|nr:helix-turn-helix domain-containing protein [Caulobacter flavus]AYV48165.1 hypothetical protein C1707_18900 [Caulobacter flavus]PLR06911.1 hypothetical protein CFHF_23655 [Caulobacter flavus]